MDECEWTLYERGFTVLSSVHFQEKVVNSDSDRQERCLCFYSSVSAGCVSN